jgi:hypothetical protein
MGDIVPLMLLQFILLIAYHKPILGKNSSKFFLARINAHNEIFNIGAIVNKLFRC